MQVRAGGLPPWIPTPFANRRFRAARTPYDDAVLGVIAERRRNSDGRSNGMLWQLIALRDSKEQPLSDKKCATA